MQNLSVASNFANTITKLDALIHRLEVNTGSPHRPSPFTTGTGVTQPPAPHHPTVDTANKTPAQTANNNSNGKEGKSATSASQPKSAQSAQSAASEESKGDKPKAEKAEKEIPPGTIEDFAKLDIRVGRIVECWKVLLSSFFSHS
jgi:hypothetical protein